MLGVGFLYPDDDRLSVSLPLGGDAAWFTLPPRVFGGNADQSAVQNIERAALPIVLMPEQAGTLTGRSRAVARRKISPAAGGRPVALREPPAQGQAAPVAAVRWCVRPEGQAGDVTEVTIPPMLRRSGRERMQNELHSRETAPALSLSLRLDALGVAVLAWRRQSR